LDFLKQKTPLPREYEAAWKGPATPPWLAARRIAW